jgi:Xaa-Pro aminopeptidase
MNKRIAQLAARLPEGGLDAFLVSTAENRRYLSGFTGSAGYLIVTSDRLMLFTDSRYTQQASNQALDFEVAQIQGNGWDWLTEVLKESNGRRLGFESENMTVAAYHRMLDTLKEDQTLERISLIPATGVVEELRVTKDQDELALLQKAIDASDAAMEAVCPTIQEGMTEREMAWRLETAMREFGADSASFSTIVAAGPNGSMAHHRPSDRVIRQGEPIVIDMGARIGGYCSDITRTVVVGEPDEMFRKIYDIVLGAQLTAINIVRPGVTGGECDSLARAVMLRRATETTSGIAWATALVWLSTKAPGSAPSRLICSYQAQCSLLNREFTSLVGVACGLKI